METKIIAPDTYQFTRNGESTVSYSGQTTRIHMATELVTALKDFDENASNLLEMYANQTENNEDADPYEEEALNESSKSIKSKIAASVDFFSGNTVESSEIKETIESWIIAQTEDIFPNANMEAEMGQAGQLADGSSVRYVSAKGIEYNQLVSKSIIGALIVDQICNNYLSSSVLDAGTNRSDNNEGVTSEGNPYTAMEHKWDEAYGYLFGANPDNADPLANLGDDSFLNKYLASVDLDPDFGGIAEDIFNAFTLGRAAIVEKEYELRDEQANILRGLISKVVAIRAVFYLQQGKIALLNEDYGGAFHNFSEGLGFVYSLRFTRRPNSEESYFSSSEVFDLFSQMTGENGFWSLTENSLDELSEVIAAKFDFTVSQAAN